MKETKGRRIPYSPGLQPYDALEKPGDYYGPDKGEYTADIPAVHFFLPIADSDDPKWSGKEGSGLHHVQSPPHVFTEEPDGTLTIRESIGAGRPFYWHGYLTKGIWEEI